MSNFGSVLYSQITPGKCAAQGVLARAHETVVKNGSPVHAALLGTVETHILASMGLPINTVLDWSGASYPHPITKAATAINWSNILAWITSNLPTILALLASLGIPL